MPEPLITVLTVNYNSSDFVGIMLYALRKLTRSPYKVIICDNGSVEEDKQNLAGYVKGYENTELIFRQQTGPGSIAHGEALDILIRKADTKYTVVMDADCTFLIKDWDLILTGMIDDVTKIAGSTSPAERGGGRIGKGEFPMPFAALFETETYRKLGISCMPGDILKGQDSCWQWADKFLGAGFKGGVLIPKNTRDFKEGPFADLTGVEEYYTDTGDLVASHFGRGSTSGAHKYFRWLKAPLISKYIKRYYGGIEKRKWIYRCREIIDSQSYTG